MKTPPANSITVLARQSFALCLGLMLGGWGCFSTLADQGQQNFDSDPAWEGIGNREAGQDFGFSDSANAGGQPGEMGGAVARAAERAYYATVVQQLSLEDTLSCTGRVAVTQADGGNAFVFGWFNSAATGWPPANYLGFRADGNGPTVDVYAASGNSQNSYQEKRVASFQADGKGHTFNFLFDPAGNNGQGELTLIWDGAEAVTMPLNSGHRAAGSAFDRFGLHNLQVNGGTITVFFDDLNFTRAPGVPPAFPPKITDLRPATGTDFADSSGGLSFVVSSPSTGVATNAIQLVLNGTDRSADLVIGGDNNTRQASLGGAGLEPNTIYTGTITATDLSGKKSELTFRFNTFRADLLMIEVEDYNFSRGQFIANPTPSDVPAADGYLGRVGIEGIDFHQVDTAGSHIYRDQDAVGTSISGDSPRQKYIDNVATEVDVHAFGAGEWLNYTRTFSLGAYLVYARGLLGGPSPLNAPLERIFGDVTTPDQVPAALGGFRVLPLTPPAAVAYGFVLLTDTTGNPVVVKLNGQQTLRLSVASHNFTVNYLLFVPTTDPGLQLPILGNAIPAPGQTNVPPDSRISFTITHRDTKVVASSIELSLNDLDLSRAATVQTTPAGASVTYQPPTPLAANSVHHVRVVFRDDALPPNSWTNQWEFTTGSAPVKLVQVQQNFDVDPAWEALNNRTAPQDFGFSDSANAGGSTGEMGGFIARTSASAYYAADIGALTLEHHLVSTGRVVIAQSTDATAWLFGWFNASTLGWPPPNYIGFRTDGNGPSMDVYLRSDNSAGNGLEQLAFPGIPADGAPHTFRLEYDPAANEGNGALTLAWDESQMATLNLTGAHRAPGSTFNRFGLLNLQVGGNPAAVFFDELNYTSVASAPPPAPQIINPQLRGNAFSLSFATVAGKSYTVQFKNALTEASWQSLPAILGDGTVKTVTDSAATVPARFYRVKAQ